MADKIYLRKWLENSFTLQNFGKTVCKKDVGLLAVDRTRGYKTFPFSTHFSMKFINFQKYNQGGQSRGLPDYGLYEPVIGHHR